MPFVQCHLHPPNTIGLKEKQTATHRSHASKILQIHSNYGTFYLAAFVGM